MRILSFVFNLYFYHLFLLLKTVNTIFTTWFINLFYRFDFIKKRFIKFGIKDPVNYFLSIENHPINGRLINIAYVIFGGWIVLLLFAIVNISNTISNNGLYTYIFRRPLIVTFCILSELIFVLFLSWFFLERNKQYLVYFRFFAQRKKEIRVRNILLAILLFLVSVSFILLSFILMVI